LRYVEVVYGPTEDKHAMLIYGGDVWVEVEPRKWARLCDLPSTHPAVQLMAKGGLQAAVFIDGNGQQITRLNAYNEQHRALAAKEGLHISVPYNPNKREELLKTLESLHENFQILMESRLIDLQERINRIKERLELLKVEKQIDEKAKAQALWDSAVNESLSIAEALEKAVKLSNMLFPSRYKQWALRQAIEKAKQEAALEETIEESILLNPEKLKELRQKLLD